MIKIGGIVEVKGADNFLEWIDKEDQRFIIILTDDHEAIYKPTVSTSNLDKVFTRNLTNEEIKKIKDEIKKSPHPLSVRNCHRYYFKGDHDPRFSKE